MSAHRRPLVVLLVGVLAALGLYAVPAAQAASPGPTTTGIIFIGENDQAGQTITIVANVRPADGSAAYPSGSVTFSVGDGAPVPLDPQYLNASITYTIPSNAPFAVTATFAGTGGWGDSSSTRTYQPLAKAFWDTAIPTVLKIGLNGGLTLKLGVFRRNAIGGPIAGRTIAFTLFGPVNSGVGPARASVPVCTATTDANGLAQCGGSAALAALVSILGGGAYATEVGGGDANGLYHVKIPAIKVG